MNKIKIVLLQLFCMTCACSVQGVDWGSAGSVIAIPSGVTVYADTAEAVAKLGAAETIEIPSGSSLVVRYAEGGRYSADKCPIPASISGAGRLAFYGVGGAILSGDNSGFSGELYSSNTYLRVQHANALGTADVTHYTGSSHYERGAITFEVADASYANDFHFLEGAVNDAGKGSRSVYAVEKTYLTGSVRITGCVLLHCNSVNSGYLYVMCDISHDGRIGTAHGGFGGVQIRGDLNPDIVFDYGDGVIQVTANSYWYGGSYRCGRFVLSSGKLEFYNAGDVSFSPNTSLQFGSDFLNDSGAENLTASASLSVPGTGMTFSFSNLLYHAGITESDVMSQNHSINTGGATIRFTGCGPSFGSNVKFQNKVNIIYDCQTETPGELLLLSPESTTSGALSASRGTLVIGEGARFPNVTVLNVSGEGVIEIRDAAAFAEGAVSVYFDGPGSGTLKVAPGERLTVKNVYVNGRMILPGTYFGAEGVGAFCLTGGGELVVNEGSAVTECYWTGKARDGDARNADNWWTAPKFDGTERLNFSSGWVSDTDIGKIVFSGESRICGINMSLEKDFEFAAADDNTRVIICPNGPVADNREGTPMNLMFLQRNNSVTYVWSAPLVFSHGYESAMGFQHQRMRFTGPISGGDADHPIRMVRYNWGGPSIELAGDNSGLLAPLEIVNVADLLVTSPTGLGSTNRVSVVRKGANHVFRFGGAALTNDTPFEVYTQDFYDRTSDTMIVSTNTPGVFMQKGELKVVGGSRSFMIKNSAFYGGVTGVSSEESGGDIIRFRYCGTEPFDCSGGPFRFEDKEFRLFSDNVVDFNLGATGSVWRLLHLERVAVNCLAEDVLSEKAACEFGSAAYGSSGGVVKLNGFDQKLGSLYQYKEYEVEQDSPLTAGVVVESPTPAILTLSPDSDVIPAIVRFSGVAGLRVKGTDESSLTFARGYSETAGPLIVESGTLVFKWGAGWGGTDVSVTGGTLRFAEGSTDVPFGFEKRADVRLSGSGRISIDAGLKVIVGAVSVDGIPLVRGRWGGPECSSVSEKRRIAALAGHGVLSVTEGASGGFSVILR